MHLKNVIAGDLGVPSSLIDTALLRSRSNVKMFTIKKRDGKLRYIFHPSKKLKVIQYWLMRNVLCHLPVHGAAMAYLPNTSILDNAKLHRASRYFLRMDLRNFFPSIRFADLLPIIEAWHKNSDVDWPLDDDSKELINRSCFYRDDRLAVGYPSSPIISNVVMYKFDEMTVRIVLDGRFGSVKYSRYADDLVFSTDKIGACRHIEREVKALIRDTNSPDIQVNSAKTRYGSSGGGTASVTGLKICENGHITIHRKQKDHVRLLLSLYSRGKLREDEHMSLQGHLSYCHHVAPAFFTSLSAKYFNEIDLLMKKASTRLA